MGVPLFLNAHARCIADEVIAELQGCCSLIAVKGEIAAGRPHVEEIDVMAVPMPEYNLWGEKAESLFWLRLSRLEDQRVLIALESGAKVKKQKSVVFRFVHRRSQIPINIEVMEG